MHVVVAPDKFKDSLRAGQVAEAVAAGLRRSLPELDVRLLPVADGGDGTLDAVVAAGYERHEVTVSGPTGGPVATAFAMHGDTAVVELADACGLSRLPGGRFEPMRASSRGLGELIAAALGARARTVVLGVGGSASTDGGAGMLAALGARIADARGKPVSPGGGGLAGVAELDLDDLDPRVRDCTFVLASDVDNPLLGERGAAAVYAEQKGADPAQVRALEHSMRRWSELVAAATGADHSELPGAGAAGGVGFGALAALGARRRSGIGAVLNLVGMHDQLEGARLVVTGEGSLDEQSLHGKTPIGVADAAADAGVPTVAVAGRCTLRPQASRAAGLRAVYPLTELRTDAATSMREAPELLRSLGAKIADEWLGEQDCVTSRSGAGQGD